MVFALCSCETGTPSSNKHPGLFRVKNRWKTHNVKKPKYGVTFNEPRKPLANGEASSFIVLCYQAGFKNPVIRRLKFPRFKCKRVEKSENFAFSRKIFKFFEDFEWNT